jgi:hypothetical protein
VSPVIEPPRWTKEQLEKSLHDSAEEFARARLQEPLEDYLEAFDHYLSQFEELLETTVDLTDLQGPALEIVSEPHLREAFRYIAAPPISEDDLRVLANVQSFKKARLTADPDEVQRIISVVRQVLDRRRFSWLVEKREPTEAEKNAASMASAALAAVSRVQTRRRHFVKQNQEAAVQSALKGVGFLEVGRRKIDTLSKGPAAGEFCGESMLGGRKADIVLRLWDDRIMPVECKVSNSSINSVKRLNNDAAAKAESWRTDFGRRQVVPTAVLSGVYKIHNLIDAQERGLTIFWAHQLNEMTDWITSTRTSSDVSLSRQ